MDSTSSPTHQDSIITVSYPPRPPAGETPVLTWPGLTGGTYETMLESFARTTEAIDHLALESLRLAKVRSELESELESLQAGQQEDSAPSQQSRAMPSNAQSPVLLRWEQKQYRGAQERRSVLYNQWSMDVERLYEAHRVLAFRAAAQWEDLDRDTLDEDSRQEVRAAHARRMQVLAKVEGQHAPMFSDASTSQLAASRLLGVSTQGQSGEPASRTSAGRSRAPDAVSGREAPTGSASAQQSGRTVPPSILGKRQAPAMARWAPKRRTTTQISTTGLNEKVSVESDSSLSSLGPDTPSTPDRFRLSGEQTGDADLEAFLTMSFY